MAQVRRDLTGKRFGRLVALRPVPTPRGKKSRWLCQCDCGNKTVVMTTNLIRNTRSCGCLQRDKQRDLRNQRFGRLLAIYAIPSLKKKASGKSRRWLCQCDCGETTIVDAYTLAKGYSRSCGCLARELVSKRSVRDLTGCTFGRWVVLGRAGSNRRGLATWKCQCECGNVGTVDSRTLLAGRSRSCGCYNRQLMAQRMRELHKRRVKHDVDVDVDLKTILDRTDNLHR